MMMIPRYFVYKTSFLKKSDLNNPKVDLSFQFHFHGLSPRLSAGKFGSKEALRPTELK